MILELLAKGAAEKEILEDYPQLEPEDLRAALFYAHHLVAGKVVFETNPTNSIFPQVNREKTLSAPTSRHIGHVQIHTEST